MSLGEGEGSISTASNPRKLSGEWSHIDPHNKLSEATKAALRRKFMGKKEPSAKPTYDFVYFIHAGEKNYSDALQLVKEADVICFEWEDFPQEDKEGMMRDLNESASGTMSPQRRKVLMEWLEGFRAAPIVFMIKKFFEEFQDSGKVFIAVDTCEEDSTGHAFLQQGESTRDELESAMFSSGQTIDTLRDLTAKYLKVGGEELNYRDDVVSSQLVEVDSLLSNTPAKVAVVQGMIHTKTYQDVSRLGFSASRNFVPSNQEQGAQIRFNYRAQGERIGRLTDASVPQSLLNRILVEKYIMQGRWGSRRLREAAAADPGYLVKKLDQVSDEAIEEGLTGVLSLVSNRKGSSVNKTAQKAGDYLVKQLGIDLAA